MEELNIYHDIAQRTNGDIYIGVVGPVRTGKSTFIKKFMEELVIPRIDSNYQRERAIDELPQSAAGRTIMTTEPKFIPEESIKIMVDETANMNVRLIDCVGFIVPSSLGYIENEAPRMVRTPWFEDEIPFNMAAEIGTQKVISEHSTIGLVVTTDGSFTDIPREEYEEAEQRVINELKSINKPFVIMLNTMNPENSKDLVMEMIEKYGVPVIPVNAMDLNEDSIQMILAQILYQFPVKEVSVDMPKWITLLEKDHWLKSEVYKVIKENAADVSNLYGIHNLSNKIDTCDYIKKADVSEINLGRGNAKIDVVLKNDLFYKVLAEKTGINIADESSLLEYMMELSGIKEKYDRISSAYDDVLENGYGIVMPSIEELTLEEPEIVRQDGKYGVKLKAGAPSVHMIQTKIYTELTPVVGTEEQSEEFIMYMLNEFEENPSQIWESNLFGKSLHELVNEGLHNKLHRMPEDARIKVKETIERIINEGCNGLVCIIL